MCLHVCNYLLRNIHIARGEHTHGPASLLSLLLGIQNPWCGPLSNLIKGLQGAQNKLFAIPTFPKHTYKSPLQLCVILTLEVALSFQEIKLVDFRDSRNDLIFASSGGTRGERG